MPVEIVLGVDPGNAGAVAVLDTSGRLIEVFDMPHTQVTKTRVEINAPLLAAVVAKSHATKIYCEQVGPRPTDGRVGAFSFGRGRGVVEGVAAALGIPIVFIAPQVWKNASKVPPLAENKEIARTRAIARWPDKTELFEPKTRLDRAEAALIGYVGLTRDVLAQQQGELV